MDASGNAMVVWPRFHPSRSDLWASRGAVGGDSDNWERALRIDAVPGYIPTPVVKAATGLPGQFTVLWEAQEGSRTGLNASHYRPGQGWRAASPACVGQLQALATAGPAKVRLTALAKHGHPVQADLCY
jgi:hypothetical protein